MTLVAYEIPITTDSSGNCTAYSEQITNGMAAGIRFQRTVGFEIETSADVSVITEYGRIPIWVDTDIGLDRRLLPTTPLHDIVGQQLVGDINLRALVPVVDERIEVVIANGGDTLSCTIFILVDLNPYGFDEPEEE